MYDLSKEVQVYKASLPYMVAAKDQANAAQMNDHGPLHAQRVHSNAKILSLLFNLPQREESLLLAAALLHDIGMAKNREEHHITSYEIVIKQSEEGHLPFDKFEAEIVATLCKWHRKEYDRDYIDPETNIKVGFLATLLRVADGMDLDYRRSTDFHKKAKIVDEFYTEQRKHHLSVINVVALKVVVDDLTHRFEIYVDQYSHANEQVKRLIDELLDAQLPWPIQVVPTHDRLPKSLIPRNQKAVIFAYCNAHGLISAAITKKQFEALGFETEVVCNYEKTVSPTSFWKKHMPEYDFSDTTLVALIDLYITDKILEDIAPILEENRHCSWKFSSPLGVSNLDINKMINSGITISFCDERALFAGNALDKESLFWLKVAGLCNFDDQIMYTMAGKNEYLISRGLRYEIGQGITQKHDADYFNLLITKILNNEKETFKDSSAKLDEEILKANIASNKYGRVLVFDETSILGRSIYDYIYQSIDAKGTLPYEEGEFATPFAIYPLKNKYGVRILFMSKFNDLSKSFPIKYFTSEATAQVGSTSTIWQTFPDEESALLAINETIVRINEHFGERCDKQVTELCLLS